MLVKLAADQAKRTIAKKEYEEKRAKANAAAAKKRKEIFEEKGKEALKGKHIDHIEPIAKGGHPTAKKNMRVIPAKKNLSKGAK